MLGWNLLGYWIGSDKFSRIRFTIMIFNCMEVWTYGFFQFLYCLDNLNNIKIFLDGLTPWITQALSVLRVLILVWYRKELKNVLDYLKNIFENTTDYEERKINARANQTSSLLLACMWFCNVSTDMSYIIYPIGLNIYRYLTGQEILYLLPFKAWFPFEYNYFPLYPIIYIFSIHSGNMTVACFGAGEGTVFNSCFHLAAQFEIISHKIKKIAHDDDKNSPEMYSEEKNNRIYDELIKIINMHNEAIEKCAILSRVLWKNIFLLFVCSAFLMCISGLMFLQTNDASIMIYVFYISAYFVLSFNYTYSGNALINASTGIYQTSYNFPWYKCNVKVRRVILFILIRAQKKVNLKVPFFEVDMETFASVRIFKF
ncbi:hypothetical protein PVAND_000197 [Polypedilum vanderplanki]|uniref:Odorant receptor n=1 Tax=Polypedilum vanderplanki TaxID=319348 RepID=A0A9J6BK59_POLVA|nr:hypothetical protein PVAND_000197 [Polypedilum vanderplanki]